MTSEILLLLDDEATEGTEGTEASEVLAAEYLPQDLEPLLHSGFLTNVLLLCLIFAVVFRR